MDGERIMTEGLRRAAEQAPGWDDTLLPPPASPARRGIARSGRPRPEWGWLAVAASVLLVVGIAAWATPWGRLQVATPAATPSPTASAALATTPVTPADAGLAADGTRPLVGTTWVTENLNGPALATLPLAQRPWVRFEPDGTLLGHDGCNALSGTYRVDADRIEVGALTVGAVGCGDHPAAGFVEALAGATTMLPSPSGLALSHADHRTVLTLHTLTRTEDEAPPRPMLRLLNNTGRAIASVRASSPGTALEFGALATEASGEYVASTGELHRYARLEVTFADGSELELTPTDYVGEVPLAPGWYTYVLSVSPLHGPPGSPDSTLVLGLEEAGRPAP